MTLKKATMNTHPSTVKIVEVGPRDGLQNEKGDISVQQKVKLIELLIQAGITNIEAGSFVSPKWVPQMADSAQVFQELKHEPGVSYSALTPNIQGFNAAMNAKADEVAIFAAASEAFSQKNINCSIDESVERFKPLIASAQQHNIPVRAYISCVVGCPYQGEVNADVVAQLSAQLVSLGCYEVSLGDTIGVGTPATIIPMLEQVKQVVDLKNIALHCHDTYGQALSNIYAALQTGVHIFDSSISGLGGCPYAKGASGNVATEDVLYLLQGLNIQTGIDLQSAIKAGNYISGVLNRPNQSRVAQALSS